MKCWKSGTWPTMFIKGSLLSSLNFSKIMFWPPSFPKDLTFEFNLDYVVMLPKFTGFEDLYLLFVSLRKFVCWFTSVGYQTMLWGWNSFHLLSKIMLKGGHIVLRLVLFNHGILSLTSSLRDTFPLVRSLDLGMNSYLLSK